MQRQKLPYVVLGTGDLAVEKTTDALNKVRAIGREARRTDYTQLYDGLAKRGESLVKKVQRSRPAKQAVRGSKQASRQLKGAVTSIRKAIGLEEQKTARRKAG
jgi:hypothetical protein